MNYNKISNINSFGCVSPTIYLWILTSTSKRGVAVLIIVKRHKLVYNYNTTAFQLQCTYICTKGYIHTFKPRRHNTVEIQETFKNKKLLAVLQKLECNLNQMAETAQKKVGIIQQKSEKCCKKAIKRRTSVRSSRN